MKNLAGALIKAQKEMAPLLKDTKGNFGKYATLASVQDVCLPALGNHGIAVFQSVSTDWEGNSVFVRVSCILVHAESGEQWTPDPLLLVPAKTDPQGIGSAITYGRRYILMAVAGIAPEDDDGQLASTGTVQAPSKQTAQRTQTPPQATQQPVTPSSNGHSTEGATGKSNAFKRFMAEGTGTFESEWENARHWMIERYTKKMTPDKVRNSANDLSEEELAKITESFVGSKDAFKAEWNKQKAKQAVPA